MPLGFLDRAVLTVLKQHAARGLGLSAPRVRELLGRRYNVNAVQASLERLAARGYAEYQGGHPGLFQSLGDVGDVIGS